MAVTPRRGCRLPRRRRLVRWLVMRVAAAALAFLAAARAGAVDCVGAAPAALGAAQRRALCARGAPGAAACARAAVGAAPRAARPAVVALCAGAVAAAPGACFAAAAAQRAPEGAAACGAARDGAPAACLGAVFGARPGAVFGARPGAAGDGDGAAACAAAPGAVTACARALPRSVRAAGALDACAPAAAPPPPAGATALEAACASSAARALGRSTAAAAAAALCRGGDAAAAAGCVAGAPRGLAAADRVRLCGSFAAARVRAVERLSSSPLPPRRPMTGASCRTSDASQVFGGHDSGTAEGRAACAAAAIRGGAAAAAAAQLCKKAAGESPTRCAAAAGGPAAAAAAALCATAGPAAPDAPAACARAVARGLATRGRPAPPRDLAALCAGAGADPRGIQGAFHGDRSRGARRRSRESPRGKASRRGPTKRPRFRPDSPVDLHAGTDWVDVAACAVAARAAGAPATEARAACSGGGAAAVRACGAAARVRAPRLAARARAALCAGAPVARPDAPAACAAELLAAATAASDAVAACRGANLVAPARCARACLGPSHTAAAACRGHRGLEACRRARRTAAALAIGRVEPPALTAGAPFALTVRVVDARGDLVGAEASTAVPVVATVSADGAPLRGARAAAARGGVATFAPLRVDRPGTYVLRVAAAGLAAVAIRVTVASDPWDAAAGASPGGICAAALVDAARCPPGDAAPAPPGGAAPARAGSVVVARVPAGALVARGALAGCAAPLAAAGFRCDAAAWAPRPRVAARAGLLWLEAAALDRARRPGRRRRAPGAPRPRRAARGRRGAPRRPARTSGGLRGAPASPAGAPAGAAYRSAARSWHPDRWTAARPRYRAAAAENFARVGCAYARLRDGAPG